MSNFRQTKTSYIAVGAVVISIHQNHCVSICVYGFVYVSPLFVFWRHLGKWPAYACGMRLKWYYIYGICLFGWPSTLYIHSLFLIGSGTMNRREFGSIDLIFFLIVILLRNDIPKNSLKKTACVQKAYD